MYKNFESNLGRNLFLLFVAMVLITLNIASKGALLDFIQYASYELLDLIFPLV